MLVMPRISSASEFAKRFDVKELVQPIVKLKDITIRGRPVGLTIHLVNRGSALVKKNSIDQNVKLKPAVERGLLPEFFRGWGVDYKLNINIPVGPGVASAKFNWNPLVLNMMVQTMVQMVLAHQDGADEFERAARALMSR
jgi:hypothetical protein